MRRSLLILSIAFSSCTTSSLEPTNADNYPANISSIMQANCLGGNCHAGSTPLNARFDLSSWNAMTKGSIYLNEIIPYNALKSHLFGHINTNAKAAPVIDPTMPLARDPLSAADQKAFSDWINEGAKSADGKIPYSDVIKKIFIINQAEDMFSVIDANTQKVVRIPSVGDTSIKYKPASIAMMPDRSSFIIAMLGAKGAVRKYDQATYAMTGECISNLIPNEIALTPDGSKGYITDNSSLTGSRFCVFDPQAMKLTKTLSSPLILQPFAVTVAPDGRYAYMSGYSSDNILRIDTHTDSVVGNMPLGIDVEVPVGSDYIRQYLPSKIVISSDSKRMYVTCVNTSEVVVFDLEKDSIVSRITLPNSPRAEALSPDGKELWAATWVNTMH
ncbi:MAG: YncE family protein, partial [Candidatus Kapaibacterium sp.]